MSFLFNEYLYRPILNLLIFTYDSIVADFGISIILITIVVRFILLPIFYKGAKDQTILQKIAPQIREIQKKHKDNKEQQVQEMLKVYKDHKVNPFSSILLLIIQLPILFALYKVFIGGIPKEPSSVLYSFITLPTNVDYTFLGFIDLSKPYLLLVIITALAQFAQSWLLLRVARKNKGESNSLDKNNPMQAAEKMSKKMIYFMPIFTALIMLQLPSAIALYWFTTSIFSAIQQVVINKTIRRKDVLLNTESN